MLIQNKKIAIVGGGPGGLTLARLLQLKGAEVKVYERDIHKDVRVQGATLDLHEESGLNALQQAGLMEAFKANFRPGADKMRLVDKNATIILDEDINGNDELFRPEIDRGPLRKILLKSLQPETVIWNSQLVSLSQLGEGWKLEFQNGTSALADIVIAADGANSKIRPLLTPIRPFYSGVTIVEATVHHSETAAPNIHQLLNGGKIFAMGDEKTIIVSSKGDGSLVFYTGCKTDEYWSHNSGINFSDKTEVLAWFQQEFSGWDSLWLELFEKADAPFIPRPQYCMPLDQTWEPLPNLTMLGDAAHLMPPYAGEGVNMAMLDALELSICLTNPAFPDLRTAIASYEKQMNARFADVGKITLEQTASLHSPQALSNMIEMFS
jgi:2-polyprenyl-6-methoxyphenol hydroxylase-like FAD-dependent oxidoreductase